MSENYYDIVCCASWFLSMVGFTLLIYKHESEEEPMLLYGSRVFLGLMCFIIGIIIFVKAISHEYKRGIEACQKIYQTECNCFK